MCDVTIVVIHTSRDNPLTHGVRVSVFVKLGLGTHLVEVLGAASARVGSVALVCFVVLFKFASFLNIEVALCGDCGSPYMYNIVLISIYFNILEKLMCVACES